MEEKEKGLITIIVAGSEQKVEKNEELTYERIVTFAFPDFPEHPERNYSVSFERGHGEKPEGFLNPGGTSVKAKEGMKFYVDHTGES
jgi:hypothetical protein